MSDRTSASIDIGGDLARDRIPKLAKLLGKTFDSPENGKSFKDLICEASERGVTLYFELDEVDYGHFGIEDQLGKLGLSYDLEHGSGYGYPDGKELYRAGMSCSRGFTTSYGEVVVCASDVRSAIELIAAGKCAEAATALGVELGDDVPELPPLRIV